MIPRREVPSAAERSTLNMESGMLATLAKTWTLKTVETLIMTREMYLSVDDLEGAIPVQWNRQASGLMINMLGVAEDLPKSQLNSTAMHSFRQSMYVAKTNQIIPELTLRSTYKYEMSNVHFKSVIVIIYTDICLNRF